MWRPILVLLFYVTVLITAFSPKFGKFSITSSGCRNGIVCVMDYEKVPSSQREVIIASTCKKAVAFLASLPLLVKGVQARVEADDNLIPTRIYQTKSGLQYFDIREGAGQAPRGLDEAIHTMKPGGKRRAIIPKNVGYTVLGIGPLPLSPKARRRLGEVVDLVDRDDGQLVFDIDLLLVADDENDQGYYEDIPLSQEEVRKLVLKSITDTNPELLERMKKTTPKTGRGM